MGISMTQKEFMQKIQQTKRWKEFYDWYVQQKAGSVIGRGQFISQPLSGQLGYLADFLRDGDNKAMAEILTAYGALGKYAARELILKAFDL